MRFTSVSWTCASRRSWRLRLDGFFVRMCRRWDWPRLKPFAVLRKRFAAARLVFNLGIADTPDCVAPLARRVAATAYGRTNDRGAPRRRRRVTSFLVQTP